MQGSITPLVSVIVSSHRKELIEGLVSSLGDAMVESVPVEIIVVTDYNPDRYRKENPHVRWIYIPDKSISKKRNKGIVSAKSNICAFIDDDCTPDETWIIKAVTFLENHPDLVGVEGLTTIEKCDRKGGAYREYKRLERQGYRTNNIFYRRKALLDIKMFDERFTVQREDVDLAYSLIEAGYSIGYSREIKITHRLRKDEKWDLLKNCVNRRFDPLLHAKHKKLYRHYIGTPYPRGITLILLAHLFLVFGIKVSSRYIFLFAVIDALIIFLFTIRRTGPPSINATVQWFREYISFALSPVVILGALLYGSIRFKHPFLV